MEIGQKVIVTGRQNHIEFNHAIGIIKSYLRGYYSLDFQEDYIMHPEHYITDVGAMYYFHNCSGRVISGYGYNCKHSIVHPFIPQRQTCLALYKRHKGKEVRDEI